MPKQRTTRHILNPCALAVLLALGLAALLAPPAWGQAKSVKLQRVAKGLTAPLQLVSPPDSSGRRFIVDQVGQIRVLLPGGELLKTPFLDLKERLEPLRTDYEERGLLALAFHPNFGKNGRFFVSYSAPVRNDAELGVKLWHDHTQHVSEFRVTGDDPNVADGMSERIVLRIDWPQFNHNGGALAFGADGMLYISTGDGGYQNDWGIGHHMETGNAQRLDSLHGKILRIDVERGDPYTVPADNPFVGRKGARGEIWALGLRNPWGMAQMPGGKGWIVVDPGQNSMEEVNLVTRGANLGWRVMEGTLCFDYRAPNTPPANCARQGLTPPVLTYPNCTNARECGGRMVRPGALYDGGHAPWRGLYFFADWSRSWAEPEGTLYVARPAPGDAWQFAPVAINARGFRAYFLGVSADVSGEIYLLTSGTLRHKEGDGSVYRILP